MKRARKPKKKNDKKYLTQEESIFKGYAFAKSIEKTIIQKICESTYVALVYTLSSPPYMWDKEKVMRLKKRFDRQVVSAWSEGIKGEGSGIDIRDGLKRRGFDYEEVVDMDVEDMKPCFGEENVKRWFGVHEVVRNEE